jgi:hypothetical protein
VLEGGNAAMSKVIAVISGTFIGDLVLKRLLKLRDTTILFLALARSAYVLHLIHYKNVIPCSYSASSVPIAFATDTSMQMSNYFLLLGGLGLATLSSLMTQFVEEDEVRNACEMTSNCGACR